MLNKFLKGGYVSESIGKKTALAIAVGLHLTVSDASAFHGFNQADPILSLVAIADDFEGDIDDEVESEVEAEVEEDVEAQVEEDIETEVEEDVEAEVEEDIEAEVEKDIEAEVEEDIEAEVEEDIEAEVEEGIEAEVEEDIEAEVEEGIEAEVEEDIEGDVEEDIESEVEKDIEAEVEEDIEAEVEEDIEAEVGEDIEAKVEEEIELEVGEELEDSVEDSVDGYIEDEGEAEFDEKVEDETDEKLEDDWDDELENKDVEQVVADSISIQALEDKIDYQIDYDNYRIFTTDWLILTDLNDTELLSQGLSIVSRELLSSLNKELLRVEAPASFTFNNNGKALVEGLSNQNRTIDFNHVYDIANTTSPANDSANRKLTPRQVLKLPAIASSTKIGIIDTRINLQHPVLVDANIQQQGFEERPELQNSNAHGTAVASILVGSLDSYQGLLENAELFSSSVFFSSGQQLSITTTQSLVLALDWQVNQGVRVINLSLAGPPNDILQTAISNYCERGITIVAAVGNNGPNAPAMFPAAYDCVVGVTAITEQNRIYRRAVRGEHVDVSAFGVNVYSAAYDQGFQQMSGTSFATPFVSAYILFQKQLGRIQSAQDLDNLSVNLLDLGEPGRDSVFGIGALPIGYTVSP